MPSVEQPASLPDPPSQAEGPREAGGRDASPSPRAAQNRALFRTLCKEHGLLWRMADIIAAYKPAHPLGTQASLF